MSTASRMDRARDNAAVTRTENGHLKRKERANRDKRMAELIGKGTFPYTPAVMSWVSEKLGKKSSQVTEGEVKALVAK
jgi:hypothetical protein